MSSLENISQEGIQCLAFADSYIKKSDPTSLVPTLWIGTTLGSVITMMINLPEADLRHTQPVVVTTSGGPIFRLKGSILTMSFLDCNGALIPYSYESWKDENKDSRERRERTPTKQSSSGSHGSHTSPVPLEAGDRQFVVIASEKQARVVALPSQNCVYRQQLVDTDFVVKAEIVSLKDSVCLVSYLSTGHLSAYSLPSLRPLLHLDFLPLSELRSRQATDTSVDSIGLHGAGPVTRLTSLSIHASISDETGPVSSADELDGCKVLVAVDFLITK
ncbi:unnamed protein product [Leptosia nina]|uniref:Uncharacterized protein n=1 Tax=Leptosia nina TaxID=320188 RepID=A0AAV1IXI1_9NEOP